MWIPKRTVNLRNGIILKLLISVLLRGELLGEIDHAKTIMFDGTKVEEHMDV